MAAPKPKRVVFRIQLTVDAKKQLYELNERLGITQISITSRLVEWFAKQDEMVQTALLGLYPKQIESKIAKIILEERGE